MSDDTRARRMAVRFNDDDLSWLAEHAEDEGVEPATLVRMIVNRLRRGRPPLMSMLEERALLQQHFTPQRSPSEQRGAVVDAARSVVQETAEEGYGVAEDVLAARLAELDGGNVEQLHEPEAIVESAAIPMRRVARQQYNPGRN